MNNGKQIIGCIQQLRDFGCAVVCFIPEEMRGVDPTQIEDRLVEIGWTVIDTLTDEKNEDPTEEDWNWSIK